VTSAALVSADHSRNEHGEPARTFETAQMLRGDDARGPCDNGIASGMDAPRPIGWDPDAAHLNPPDDAFQVRRRWCFRPFAYPSKPGATIVVRCDQAFERRFLMGRAVAD
jgi:hypothetical protein